MDSGNLSNSNPCVNSEQFSSWLCCSFPELRVLLCVQVLVFSKNPNGTLCRFLRLFFCLAASSLEFLSATSSHLRFPELSHLSTQLSNVSGLTLTTFILFHNSKCASKLTAEVITWLSLFIPFPWRPQSSLSVVQYLKKMFTYFVEFSM